MEADLARMNGEFERQEDEPVESLEGVGEGSPGLPAAEVENTHRPRNGSGSRSESGSFWQWLTMHSSGPARPQPRQPLAELGNHMNQ